MENFVICFWNNVVKFELFLYENGYFVVRIYNIIDRDDIMCFGLYILNNCIVVLRIWDFKFNFMGDFFRVLFLLVMFFYLFFINY